MNTSAERPISGAGMSPLGRADDDFGVFWAGLALSPCLILGMRGVFRGARARGCVLSFAQNGLHRSPSSLAMGNSEQWGRLPIPSPARPPLLPTVRPTASWMKPQGLLVCRNPGVFFSQRVTFNCL